MHRKHVARCLTILMAGTLLVACTIPDGAKTGLRALVETDGVVDFDAGAFGGAAVERIIYATASEREEYVLYQKDRHQAEFVYITTRHLHMTNLVIDRLFDVNQAIQHFRHNGNEKPVLGEAFKVSAGDIGYWAKPFGLPTAGKSCAAIAGSWDHPPDDLRPSKALFGYFCQPGTTSLTVAAIRQTVGQLGLRGINVDAFDGAVSVPKVAETPAQTVLLERVRGIDGGTIGNTEFPYKSVRFFKREESCRFRPGC